MKTKNWKFYPGDFEYNADGRMYARQELVYNITEDFLVIMENQNVSKQDLAKKLGKSKSYVSQLLSGRRNMTLGTFSDMCFALGFKPMLDLPVYEGRELDEGETDPAAASACGDGDRVLTLDIEKTFSIPPVSNDHNYAWTPVLVAGGKV